MSQHVHFESYSPAADIVVAGICLVMLVLMAFSYISRTRSFHLFVSMVFLVLVAAWADIAFYTFAAKPHLQVIANWLRCVYHFALMLILVHYVAYICEVTHYEKQKRYLLAANMILAAALLADVAVTARGLSFFVVDSDIRFVRRGIFTYAYLAYIALCILLMVTVRKHLYRRVMLGFYGSMGVSCVMLVLQGVSNQSSFTVATLLFPVITMMYVLHSNPYDALLGANDLQAMQDYVSYCYQQKLDFVFMSLYMKEFDEDGKELPREMQSGIRELISGIAKKGKLFKAGNGHIILFLQKKYYPDFEEKINGVLGEFYTLYGKFRYDYKLVIGCAVDEISGKNEYVSYIRNIHRSMAENTVRRVGADEVAEFNRSGYILKELADIYHRGDLRDPRVLVYCQPVLNVNTGKYDTAEALMRLNLPEMGMICPDQFIPLAEEQGYIHILTEILLSKTCEAIRRFTEEGYELRRISVNVAVSELKEESFCGDMTDIIERSGIPSDKIAVELTESQNDDDFLLMKEKIGVLKEKGIKFYLDDFGTGYSNMERIMELPFDIIKFDRSLVIASGTEKRSRLMVASLANMFAGMDYAVLYEGVEKASDETMCVNMSATYLQGYKYAKPAPIVDLKDYLNKPEAG